MRSLSHLFSPAASIAAATPLIRHADARRYALLFSFAMLFAERRCRLFAAITPPTRRHYYFFAV